MEIGIQPGFEISDIHSRQRLLIRCLRAGTVQNYLENGWQRTPTPRAEDSPRSCFGSCQRGDKPPAHWYGSYLPEGQPAYLGVRFDQGAGWQYAWIGVVRNPDGTDPALVDAFAWGHETTPGVSIPAGAPEPASLALLAFGAVAALRRRRPA